MPRPASDSDPAASARPVRSRNAEATRQDLLRAALRRFSALGYDRTTTREIAADAGVNVSLISRYFGSKDGLFEAVLRESADTISSFPSGTPASLVDSMLSSLDPAAYPEFGGEHPFLLLLRSAGADARTSRLRQRTLMTAMSVLAERIDPDGRLPAGEAAQRAELILSFYGGVVLFRALLPQAPLATSDPAELRENLLRSTTAIVGPPLTAGQQDH